MKVSDILSSADVVIDIAASQKHELLRQLARQAASALNLSADQIAAELLKREDLGSTGTGGGIALPHARIEGMTKPYGLFAKLRHPVDFQAIDGEPVDLVFLLLLPTEGDQLGALACVARRLREPQILTQSRSARSAPELYSAVTG